ncbi:MAG: DsrE family protein [Thaumarchaeota archaeon]|nr:DsrE family protein [Nitrososphaerota archaeon]
MKMGLVISSNEPELVWNAFRYGVKATGSGHSVKVFLLGKGVESEQIDDPKFDVKKMMKEFVGKGGTILACGTCLSIRNRDGSVLCPTSTMQDLVNLTVDSDRVLTFG